MSNFIQNKKTHIKQVLVFLLAQGKINTTQKAFFEKQADLYRTPKKLDALFDVLNNLQQTKTRTADILKQAKINKNVNDIKLYNNNKHKLFSETKSYYSKTFRGNIIQRSIVLPAALDKLKGKRFGVGYENKLDTYAKLLYLDVLKAYEQLHKTNFVSTAKIQFLVLYVKGGRMQDIKFNTMFHPLNKNTNIENLATYVKLNAITYESDYKVYIIGYRVMYKVNDSKDEVSKSLLEADLLAFKASNDTKFHKLTLKSTHDNNICIYESFEVVYDIKYSHHFTRDQRLSREGKEIESAVRSGKLLQSLMLLCNKYNKVATVKFYNNKKIMCITGTDFKSIKSLKPNTKIFLYDQAKQHIAPADSNTFISEEDIIIKENKDDFYRMTPYKLKKTTDANDVMDNMIVFKFETTIDNNMTYVPVKLDIRGKLNSKDICMEFVGNDCNEQFINYMKQYIVLLNHNKHKISDKINYIYMFGFDNASIDNKFIFNILHTLDNNTEFIMGDNRIKSIVYNNLKVIDLRLIYNSDLLETVYKLTNDEDITYIDALYLLASNHVRNSIGSINGSHFNTVDCTTVGTIAKLMYKYVFQTDTLFPSPLELLQDEKAAYYGGRCDVFKRKFNTDGTTKLYYTDINSSYSKQMTKPMPYRFTRYVKINMVLTKEDIASVEDTSLYYISSYKYTGANPYIISNLCEKDDNNKMFHPLEYNNNTVHWGCEVIRALQNDFTITIYKYAMYEEKNVFESYVNYFYTHKAQSKADGDIAKALHYKNILNNLYGKFAQKQHNKISIVNRFDDIFDIIGDDLELLVNFTKLDESKGFVEYMNKDTKQDFSSLSRFSSYITALGRTQLHETMQHIGYENVYYCDTDSIFTTKLPSNEYLSDSELGCWKIEEVITSANFYGKKNYKYTTESNAVVAKLKGTSSKLSDEQYAMLDNGETVAINHNIIRRTLTDAKSILQPFSINQ